MDEILRTNSKRIALYLRVSTVEQTDKYGLDLQKDAIFAMIKSRANSDEPFIFAGENYIYVDDVSGTIPLTERPSFARLMEDIKHSPDGAKPFDAVAVYKIDRFARKLSILLDAISFFEHSQIEFISVNESIDTSTAFGRAMLSIIGVIAELERDTIKGRTSDGRIAAIQKGVHMGTSAKFGYIKDDYKRLEVCDEEALVIKNIFDLFVIQRKTVYEIADYLTSNKHLTPEASSIKYNKSKAKGKARGSQYKWHPENIRRMLSEELYIGRAYYGRIKLGKKVPKSEWLVQHVPPILDEVIFEKAQRILSESKHQKLEPTGRHSYLLSGLLRCDCCKDGYSLKHYVGTSQTVKSTGKKAFYYICKGKSHLYKGNKCSTLPIGADAVEDYILQLCINLLSNPISTYKYQKSLTSSTLQIKHLKREEEHLRKLIDDLPVRRERLRQQHELGLIDGIKLKQLYAEQVTSEKLDRERLEEVLQQLSQNTLDIGYIKTFELFNDKYKAVLESVQNNREEAYKLLHLLIENIIVYSRPVEVTDKVAGVRKDKQMVANRVHVKFRLPQDMLNEIGAQGTEKAPVGASSSQKDISGAR